MKYIKVFTESLFNQENFLMEINDILLYLSDEGFRVDIFIHTSLVDSLRLIIYNNVDFKFSEIEEDIKLATRYIESVSKFKMGYILMTHENGDLQVTQSVDEISKNLTLKKFRMYFDKNL